MLRGFSRFHFNLRRTEMFPDFPEYRHMSVWDTYQDAARYADKHVCFEFGLSSSDCAYIKRVRQSRLEVDAMWVEVFDRYVAHWED